MVSQVMIQQPGPSIDLKIHIPTLVAICANRMSRAASRFYRERYGIGIVEWRVLMFIGHRVETSANRICRETDLDKGAVSRSLNVLERRGFIRSREDGSDNRRRNIVLTNKGHALHDDIVPIALARERRLVAGMTPRQVKIFVATIQHLQGRISKTRVAPRSGKGAAERQRSRRTAARSQSRPGHSRR